jgi:RNA recognition motif-containing protein
VFDRQTGESMGYGFVQNASREHANQAVEEISGIKLENKTLRVSHAKPVGEVTEDVNVYVAGIPLSMDENDFRNTFGEFGQIDDIKILRNKEDQSPRGAGFVRYKTPQDAQECIANMNGRTLPGGTQPMVVRLAHTSQDKKMRRYNPMASSRDGGTSSIPVLNQLQTLQSSVGGATATSVTGGTAQVFSIYAYGLQQHHTELTLYELFAEHGAIQSVKMMKDMQKEGMPGKGFGFINFVKYEDAVKAISEMNGKEYEGKQLQVAFKTAKGTNTITDPNILTNIALQQQPNAVAQQAQLQQLALLQLQNQQALAALQQAGYSTQTLAAAGIQTGGIAGLAGVQQPAAQQLTTLPAASGGAGLPAGLTIPAGYQIAG